MSKNCHADEIDLDAYMIEVEPSDEPKPAGPADPLARLLPLGEIATAIRNVRQYQGTMSASRPYRCPVCNEWGEVAGHLSCRLHHADEVLAGLDPETRFRVVRALRIVAADPAVKASVLARNMGMPPKPFSVLVRRLEAAGLVMIDDLCRGCRATISARGERWLREYEAEPPRCR